MDVLVQNILDNLESSLALKNEDDKTNKFSIKINFNWSLGDFTVDVSGQGDEVISDDLDSNMSKENFVINLLDELKAFALLHIHIEITLKDCEEKKILFYTKSCTTFREKVIDITKCSLKSMLEIPIPMFNAEFYFYIPYAFFPQHYETEDEIEIFHMDAIHIESKVVRKKKSDKVKWKTNFFVVDCGLSTAALNSLACHLAVKSAYENISFICRTTEVNHNNLKKCIEHAIRVLNKHFITINTVLSGTINCDSPGNSPISKSAPAIEPARNVVDLTSEADEIDSDDEMCHNNFLRELDEEFFHDCILDNSDSEEEGDDVREWSEEEIEKSNQIINFQLASQRNVSFGDEDVNKVIKEYEKIVINSESEKIIPRPKKLPNIYENFRPEQYGQPIRKPLPQQKNEDLPTKVIKTEKNMRQTNLTFSSSAQPKSSFSSISHPQVNRPKIKQCSPHREIPKSQLQFQPKLNRGSTNNVELGHYSSSSVRLDPKHLPKSNLFSQEELRRNAEKQKESRALPLIIKGEREVRDNYLKSYNIPKKSESNTSQFRSGSVLEDNYNGPQPRRPIHPNNSVKVEPRYTAPRKESDPKYMNAFAKRMANLQTFNSPKNEQADHSTPSSLKVFFDQTEYPEYSKDSTNNNSNTTKNQSVLTDNNSVVHNIEDSDDEVKFVAENEKICEKKEVRTSKRLHSDDRHYDNRNRQSENKFFKRGRHSEFSSASVPKYDKNNSKNTTAFYNSNNS